MSAQLKGSRMESIQSFDSGSSYQPEENRWSRVGARVLRALVSSGMSQAALQLDKIGRHYETGHHALANELREAAKWAQRQQF